MLRAELAPHGAGATLPPFPGWDRTGMDYAAVIVRKRMGADLVMRICGPFHLPFKVEDGSRNGVLRVGHTSCPRRPRPCMALTPPTIRRVPGPGSSGHERFSSATAP